MSKGFGLVECMVYLVILGILSTTIASLGYKTWGFLVAKKNRIETICQAYSAHDLLLRDIHTAYAESSGWKLVNPHECIFLVGKKEVGWQWAEGKLVRSSGEFDSQTNRWRKRSKSIVATRLADVSFAIERIKNEAVFKFTISACNHKIENEVRLRQRSIAHA